MLRSILFVSLTNIYKSARILSTNADGLIRERRKIMKRTVLIKQIVLVFMLIAILALVSCSFRGCSSKCNHEWDEGILINATECGKGAIARVTCSICGETEEISAETHNYVAGEKIASTCTSMGYTEYDCMYCKASCVSDFVNALGHKYGEEMIVKQETCTTSGSYVQICENCGDVYSYSHNAKGHSYQLVLEDDVNTTFECDSCHDIVVLGKEQSIEKFIGNEELFDVEPTFSFDIVSSENEDSIRKKLKIVEHYFNDTEYEDDQDVIREYNLTYKGDNVWTVSVITDYEYDTTYIAKLQNGVSFVDYKCKELVFTVIEDPNHENSYEFQENIVFLQTLENANPGYYPYYISSTNESEYLYLAIQKVDNLEIGQVICVGNNITSTDEITDETECYFGKIDDFYPLPDGSWMVVLAEPDLSEIFGELDIAFNEDINFDEEDINVEELEAGIVQQLYASEDFIKFLSTINVSANKYFEENNYYAEELSNVKSFLDKIEIDPDVKVKGTTITATINGTLTIPIKDKNKNDLGDFKVSFTVKTENKFGLDVSYKIKWKWFKPSLKHFDLAVIQTTQFDFDFKVEIGVDYSLEENKYVQNIVSNKIHRSTCPHIRAMDNDKLQGLTVVKTEKLLKENPEWGCKHCQPTKGFKYDLLVLNNKTKAIHAYDCMHVAQMSESNKQLTEEDATYWINKGYTCCDWCHPDNREEKEFNAKVIDTLYCSDWQQVATDIVQLAKDAGVSEHASKGVTIVHVNIPIYGVLTATIDINFVFSFKLEASFTYEYSYQQNNVYGMRLQNGGVHAYTSKESKVLENKLTLMGKAEIRAGLMLDVNINIKGLSKWIRAGVTAEVGAYAKLSGILSISSTNDENYAAAYLEVGIYVDVRAYYKLIAWDGNFKIYSDEFPLFYMGYAKAYYGYQTYHEELEIHGSYDIDAENLLAVKYFDLKTMTTSEGELSLSEKNKYRVNIVFEDGSYCEIRGGKIVAKSNAPCYFKDKITITVDCDDSWKDFKKDSSVYYLGTYEIEIEFYSDNDHTYDSDIDEFCNLCGFERTIACYHTNTVILTAVVPTCTETGLTEGKKCLACDKIIIEQTILPANGHTVVIDPGIEATCTSTGLTEGKHCSVCNAILVRQTVIEMLDHVYSVVITPPTCTQKGYTTFTCTCGDTHVGNYTDKIPHSYSVVIVEPTCTENGYATYTCSCGDTYVEKLDAKGHTVVIDEAVAPTCTSTGLTEGKHCSVCSTVIVAQTVIDIIDCIESDWIVDVPATKTEDGSQHKECIMCSTKMSEEIIPATGSLGLEYTLNGDGKSYSVTGIGTCTDTDVIVSNTYNGFPVTIIGNSAFANCASVTSVTIPDTVTIIRYSAFAGCTSLININIPDSVSTILNGAFKDCTSLKSVTIPSSITTINWLMFDNCESLESVTIPDQVTSIESYAFRGCSSLININIPDSVTTINLGTFMNCTALTSIQISDSTTTIDKNAFYNCCSLTSLNIPATVTNIGNQAFDNCTALATVTFEENSQLVSIGKYAFYNCTSLKNIEIPDSVTSIGDTVFRDCISLENASLSNNITIIDEFMFYNCAKLESIVIPDNVTCVGDWAFMSCTSLTDITIPISVTNIGHCAFSNCKSLTSVEIPDSVTSIGRSAFYYCISLTSIEIPNSVTSIGESAFSMCESLTNIDIPDSITHIDDSTFFFCTSLERIKIPNSVISIGEDAFEHCTSLTAISYGGTVEQWNTIEKGTNWDSYTDAYTIYCTDGEIAKDGTVTYYPTASEGLEFTLNADGQSYSVTGIGTCTDTDIIIPDTYEGLPVTSIGNYAFKKCTSFTSVTIGDSVTSIGENAFQKCTSLTSVTIGDSVTSIGDYAFYECTSLTSVTIPDSVTNIARDAFNNCTSLTTVTIGDGVTSIGERIFYKCTSLTSVTIGDGVTSIANWTFNYCTSLISITIPESITSIGYGSFQSCTLLTSINIPASVTNIGYQAFGDCTSLVCIDVDENNQNYQSIDGNLYTKDGKTLIQYAIGKQNSSFAIPDSVTSIGGEAFAWCTSLSSVTIPESIASISELAFQSCTSLVNITIPDSVTSIGREAFYDCTSLTNVTIGDGITWIGDQAFSNCSSLTNVYYTGDVESWLDIKFASAFSNPMCNVTNLYFNGELVTSITIPDGVTSIGNYAFFKCTSLTSITIPNSVTWIGTYAFCLCDSLTSITIPDSVIGISDYAFYKCTSLISITIPDSVTNIGYQAFGDCTSLTSVTIGDGVTSIGNYAFCKCTLLTNITIPDSVTWIGACAFSLCDSLTSISFDGTVEQWNAIKKGDDWNYNTGNYTIYCTDGKIAKDGTVTYY